MLKLSRQPNDATPLYIQFADSLREHIDNGGINPGRALPSERDLTEMAGISRVTVRKGIERLIDEGLLLRKQGSGTYVAPRIVAAGQTLSGFSDDAKTRGENPGSIWIMRNYAQPLEEEAQLLGISIHSEVARLARIRLSAGEPLAIEHAVVPKELLPPLDEIGDSLYEALDKLGNRPVSGTQRIRASLATPTEAGILSIRQHAEVLRIERLTLLANGKAVELTRSAYRGDRYDFVTELKMPK